MASREQLRWGGLLIMTVSVLISSMNLLVHLNYQHVAIQAINGAGTTGLVLAASLIHIAQAKRAGMFGLLAYLISVISLMYGEVVAFLTLAELAGIQEAGQTLQGLWTPGMRLAFYGVFAGLILLGISIAKAGVFPRWSGVLLALGLALQLPAQFAMELAGPLFYIFPIGGSILFGTGLARVGWSLWTGKGYQWEEPGLSNLDRAWGGPLVILTGLLLAIDAMLNMFGELSLASAISHLLSYTGIALAAFILYAAHGSRASWIGFTGLWLTQLGATLYMITAYLIFAQLSGAIDNNRALMASWEQIPVGRYGVYMVIAGMLLFGIEAVRSGVLPRWSGWLVLLGLALALPFTFTIQAYYLGIFWVLGATLQGTGVAWMGWTILPGKRGMTEPASQTSI